MLWAIGLISSGRDVRTPVSTQRARSESAHLADLDPAKALGALGALACSDRRVPPQSGQGSCFQKFFHPLHALFVLDLGEGVFHGIDGVEVGEVQLGGLLGIFGVVENVLFLGGAVKDNLLFALASAHGKGHRCGPPSPGRRRSSATTSGSSRGPRRPHRCVERFVRNQAWCGSTVRTMPVPSQVRQAPWLLKASSSADGA